MKIPSSGGTARELIPEGEIQAVCVWWIDIGTQTVEYSGKIKYLRKIVLGFEVPSIRIEVERDGKTVSMPRMISGTYTASLHEKAILRQHLESWRGKPFTDEERDAFDSKNVVGKPCTLWIDHRTSKLGKQSAVIDKIKPPKAKTAPEIPLVNWSFDDGVGIPDSVPEWIVKRIFDSLEYERRTKQSMNDHSDIESDKMQFSDGRPVPVESAVETAIIDDQTSF